jgi:hypothetical protein
MLLVVKASPEDIPVECVATTLDIVLSNCDITDEVLNHIRGRAEEVLRDLSHK